MSNHEDEPETGISDAELPEELQPTEDNPLAQPLDEDEAKSPEELDMHGGKAPEQSSSEQSSSEQSSSGQDSGRDDDNAGDAAD